MKTRRHYDIISITAKLKNLLFEQLDLFKQLYSRWIGLLRCLIALLRYKTFYYFTDCATIADHYVGQAGSVILPKAVLTK